MTLSNDLKEFLKDPKNQNLINYNKWEEIYKELNNIFQDTQYNIGNFTKFLYAADIDPLDFINRIPSNFLYRSDIKNFNIPKSIKIIGKNAFIECDQLVDVIIPEGVTDIDTYAFYLCRNLKNIKFPKTLINIGDGAFVGCYFTDIVIPNGVTSIGNAAFRGCTSLTSIFIPNSVTNIGRSAFHYCKNLTIYCEATEQPKGWDKDWNDSNCPIIWDCNNNDTDVNGYTYTIINGLKYACKGNEAFIVGYDVNIPKNITIPSIITHNGNTYDVINIGDSAFEDCGLVNIGVPEGIISIGDNAFRNCTSLKSINIPENVENIGISAFEYCYDLLHIEISRKIKTIKADCFYDCVSLHNIFIPPNVISIDKRAFFRCTNFTSINIPPQVTVLSDHLFDECFRLKNVSIPLSVTTIGNSVFTRCTSLKTIEYNGTMEQWKNIKIFPGNLILFRCTIHCTDGDLKYDKPSKVWVEV